MLNHAGEFQPAQFPGDEDLQAIDGTASEAC
jgi:hypothetical protein